MNYQLANYLRLCWPTHHVSDFGISVMDHRILKRFEEVFLELEMR